MRCDGLHRESAFLLVIVWMAAFYGGKTTQSSCFCFFFGFLFFGSGMMYLSLTARLCSIVERVLCSLMTIDCGMWFLVIVSSEFRESNGGIVIWVLPFPVILSVKVLRCRSVGDWKQESGSKSRIFKFLWNVI